jgi:cob(I)alamin adenosyltransferase
MSAVRRADVHDARTDALTAVVDLDLLLELAATALPRHSRFRPLLARIQRDLADLVADLGTTSSSRLEGGQVDWLAAARLEARRALPPLDAPILLRRSEAAARLGRARKVSRSAGRAAAALSRQEPLNPLAVEYLERLADLLLVLARAADFDTGARVGRRRLESAHLPA